MYNKPVTGHMHLLVGFVFRPEVLGDNLQDSSLIMSKNKY